MWTWLGENGAAISTVMAVIATMMAVTTAIVAILALRQTARDSSDRSRPMVLAEFMKAENSDSAVDLVIRNAGPSVARDVSVRFDPEPAVPDKGGPYVTPILLSRYANRIAVLTPGQELKNVWWTGRAGSGEKLENGEPTPDQVTVRISYRNDRGKVYIEEIPLDVETITQTTYSISSKSVPKRLESITKSLTGIERHLETLAARD